MENTAVIAQRVTQGEPDTAEIRRLTEAAGARVLGEVTQTRARDPGTNLGRGKVDELASLVAETGADTVVVDGELTPRQTVTLEAAVGARVVDRNRVVLEIFAEQARTRRAQLQVELARLRYRLPRARERADEGLLNRFTESGTPYYDLLDRIDELERKLNELPAVEEQVRERRREAGFDLVAIAGYTNAGKTTLLRRLADDLTLESETHRDIAESAAVEDRLFKTLETTTRRATLDGRRVLLTDTVGFLDDLPHWLVESFRGTLDAIAAADAVVLVADIAQSTEELRRTLATARETIGPEHPPVVTVLNKADRVAPTGIEARLAAIDDLVTDPVIVSATTDDDLAAVERRVRQALPGLESTELELPLTDEGMSLLSWIHDEAVTVDVNYGGETVVVDFDAKPRTVARARSRARDVEDPTRP